MKYSLPEIVVFAVAVFLPAYGLRFHLGPIPMTVLEVVMLVGIIVLTANITHPTLPYLKGGEASHPPLNVRGGRRGYGGDKLLIIGAMLIFVATIVSIIVAPDRLAALGIAKAYFWEPMILAGLIVASKPDKNKIIKAAIFGFSLNAILIIGYAIFQYIFPQFIPATYLADHRVTSFYSYPNAIALYLAPLALLFLGTPWTIPLTILAVVAIFLAQSAGGMIAVAAAFFAIGLMTKKLRIATLIAITLCGVVLIFTPQLNGLRDQILMRDWSGRVHKIGWEESYAMLKDRPFFGAGLSGYQTAVTPYHTARGVEIFQYPHNLFLAIWSELGLLGLAGFGCILVWYFKKLFRDHTLHATRYTLPAPHYSLPATHYTLHATHYTLILVAAMIAILVHGLVDVPYFKNDLSAVFWLLVAIVAL